MAQPSPAPAPSEQAPGAAPDPGALTGKIDPSLVGLSVYSSDGQKLGEITEVGVVAGVPAVRAEMGEFLGLGTSSVIIKADAIARKGERVEVTLTADEVKDTVSKQREKQP